MSYASFWVGCIRGDDEAGIAFFSVEFDCDEAREAFEEYNLTEKMEDVRFYDAHDGGDWNYGGDDVGVVEEEEEEPSYDVHFRVTKKGEIKVLDRSIKTRVHDPDAPW